MCAVPSCRLQGRPRCTDPRNLAHRRPVRKLPPGLGRGHPEKPRAPVVRALHSSHLTGVIYVSIFSRRGSLTARPGPFQPYLWSKDLTSESSKSSVDSHPESDISDSRKDQALKGRSRFTSTSHRSCVVITICISYSSSDCYRLFLTQ